MNGKVPGRGKHRAKVGNHLHNRNTSSKRGILEKTAGEAVYWKHNEDSQDISSFKQLCLYADCYIETLWTQTKTTIDGTQNRKEKGIWAPKLSHQVEREQKTREAKRHENKSVTVQQKGNENLHGDNHLKCGGITLHSKDMTCWVGQKQDPYVMNHKRPPSHLGTHIVKWGDKNRHALQCESKESW